MTYVDFVSIVGVVNIVDVVFAALCVVMSALLMFFLLLCFC